MILANKYFVIYVIVQLSCCTIPHIFNNIFNYKIISFIQKPFKYKHIYQISTLYKTTTSDLIKIPNFSSKTLYQILLS